MNRFEKHMGTPLDAACLIAEYIHCVKAIAKRMGGDA